MHVYYKFGLFLIFILSVSTCYTRAAPPTTNHSLSYDSDDYHDDYDVDYYDENESGKQVDVVTTQANRLIPLLTTTTTTTKTPLLSKINIPNRSNHVLEPNCPKACLCLEDYSNIKCSHTGLTHVPHDIPSTALTIDLSENRIDALNVDDFVNSSKVIEINLNGNRLTHLDKEIFDGLRRLKHLHLANNNLNEIDADTFVGANDLRILDLSNNSIVLESEGSFLNQPNLLELACRNCTWTELYDDTFANLSGLTSLKLDQNNFNKIINTKAFTPLRNLIKLKLPELDQEAIHELCNLLKSIDNISFKHFDISCYELVLGASFNESVIFATDPPYKPPATTPNPTGLDIKTSASATAAALATTKTPQHISPAKRNQTQAGTMASSNASLIYNSTLPSDDGVNTTTVLTASVFGKSENVQKVAEKEEESYQVPVSQEAINIMLISIMIIAIIGIIIGVICRKDVGGIKTKCCRTRKPEPKDQVHPTEEIPLNKLN